jgi:hypothetical protein
VKPIDAEWAWSQVEAMAERSLPAADERRMRAAMAADPALQRAVQHAAGMRRELRRLGHLSSPSGLLARLWRIPRGTEARRWRPRLAAAALAAAALVALGLALLLRRPPVTPPDPEARAKAIAEFAVAMTYLRRSTVIAQDEVTSAVRGSMREAITREAARNRRRDAKNGD